MKPNTNNYIFVTIQKGGKEYLATVSSWHYQGKNVWLYVFAENGIPSKVGYIKNARVIESSRASYHEPYINSETLSILNGWE